MSMVFPGVAEVMASPFLPVSILMRLDFPTLERPMKAYSGNVPAGHFRTSVLLMTNSAFVISILLPFWGFTCGKGSTNFISLHYLCPESEDRLHLSIKNERVHFILHSVCTIFVANRRILSMNGQFPSTLLEKAVNEFAKLPGVGRKTAMRLVLHLLRQDTACLLYTSDAADE